jgi:hypothetical protein
MRKVALLTLALWLMLSCLACWDDEGRSQTDVAVDFFTTYKEDLPGRVLAGLAKGDTSAAEEAKAALDAYGVIDNYFQADKLMDEGRRDEDPAKMDQAIAKRPDDWSYRISRAALALQNYDLDTYADQTTVADDLVEKQGISPVLCAQYLARDLEYAESRLRITGFKSRAHCEALYASLAKQYEVLWRQGSVAQKGAVRMDWAEGKLEGCSSLPQ